jgi:hypothetical protein
MATLYEVELHCILDLLRPQRHYVRRSRASDPWINRECCDTKHLTDGLNVRFQLSAVVLTMPPPLLRPRTLMSLLLPPLLRALLLKQRGIVNGACTINYGSRNVLCFGATGSRLISQTLRSYGGQWSFAWPWLRSVEFIYWRRLIHSIQFFDDEFAKVKSCTNDAAPYAFSHVRSGASFRLLLMLTTDDVINAARRLPNKYSTTAPTRRF